jgi:hypothetical protein
MHLAHGAQLSRVVDRNGPCPAHCQRLVSPWGAVGIAAPEPAPRAPGGIEAIAALFFVVPRMIAIGAVGVLATIGIAFVAADRRSMWRANQIRASEASNP